MSCLKSYVSPGSGGCGSQWAGTQEGSPLVLYPPLLHYTVGGILVSFAFMAALLLEEGSLGALHNTPGVEASA